MVMHANMRAKVLFIGEGVTLAHVVRPLQLASSLDRSQYDPVFACDERYRGWVEERGLKFLPLPCVDPKLFLRRVYRAAPLFTLEELKTEVLADLRAFTRVRPDVVVGDFRLSLGISAEVFGIPHLALSNAHWSPRADLPPPVPEHPLVRVLGVNSLRRVSRVLLPHFFGLQARAFNRLRKTYGLEPLGGRGAHEVFTRGTRTLYLDVPELYGLGPLSGTEHYVGPVNWEPTSRLPRWWDKLPHQKPLIYITPGSSGSPRAVLQLIRALASLDVTLMVATAGRLDARDLPEGVFWDAYIPGGAAADRAGLVIGNGGSAMAYQALGAGTPILGIPVNMDQHYSMEAVQRSGAGRLLRAGALRPGLLKSAVAELLGNNVYAQAARKMQQHISSYNAVERFTSVLEETLDAG